MSRARGFTLIELIVTVTIIGFLAAMAVPIARNSLMREKESELRQALRDIRLALDKYKEASDAGRIEVPTDTEGYPQTLQALVDGVQLVGQAGKTLKFLRERQLLDPMTGTSDWGMRSYQDDPSAQSWGGQNVFDVYTTDPRIGLNGTPYKDW